MNTAETSLPAVERLEKPALVVGLAALVLCAALGFRDPVQFFRSYLLAFVFWMGLPLGCGALLMIQYLIGGTWGFPLRRPLESGTKTFYLMAVLVLPILFKLPLLYPWANSAVVQADPLLQYKHAYLNEPFFTARAAMYFAAWLLFAFFLNKWSRQQDETGDAALARRLRPYVDRDRQMLVEDIARNRPDAILVGRLDTRFHQWAWSDAAITAARADYRLFAAEPGEDFPAELYVRKDLIGLRATLPGVADGGENGARAPRESP